MNTSYNHDSAEANEISVLTDHRRRDLNDVMSAIEVAAGQVSGQILDNIRARNSATLVQIKNVYNAKLKIRRNRLGVYTSIQFLLRALHKQNWFVKFVLEVNSKKVSEYLRVNINAELIFKQIRKLFFVNKHVAEILRKNSEVIAMNAIYKINKYDMFLVIIMGHTALDTSFYIAFAFLEKEEKKDYI